MRAGVALPAPEGLTEELTQRAIYELNKLGTIESSPFTDEGAIEVFEIPDSMKPADAPKELRFLRFEANLIPYESPKKVARFTL